MPSAAALTRLKSFLTAPFEKPDVYVLFMEHTSAHRGSAWEVLVPLVARLFPGSRVRWVVIDNAFRHDADVPPQPGADALAGDPSSREFSGLDVGIAHVRAAYRPDPRSIFVLVNDTFHRSYGTEYLATFEPRRVRAALRRGMAVGYVDCYPSEVTVLGLPLRCWIRTSFVLVGARVLEAVGKLAIPIGDDQLFDGVERFFREDAPLSERYRGYVRAWLFGEQLDDYAFRWHSLGTLTAETMPMFRAKARSILCEHYLSARLRALAVPVLRVNRPGRKRRRTGVL